MHQACVCTTVRKANRALSRFYEAAFSGTGITVVQFALLRSLERREAMTLTELADEQALDRTSLYRTLAPLIERRLIDVTPTGSGRTKRAALTDSGKQQIADALPRWTEAQSRAIAKIGAENWEVLASALLSIPEHVEHA